MRVGPFLVLPALAFALGVLTPAALAATAATREPMAAPILRVETGMHTTLIRRLVVDAKRQRLLTASDDKTIRVWQLPEARLVSVLRIPIDLGHEGRLFGLALSPDGQTVAAAGWTGWDWDGSASIYLLDVATGELKRRIGGLPNAVSALVWHPDGRHLIVGLQGASGLQVVDVASGRPVVQDNQYRDKIMDIDLAADGRLAVAALDGMVRLYAPDFRLVGRRKAQGGKLPSALRFSPDGRQIALSFVDVPAISVIDTATLLQAHQPSTVGLGELAGLTSIAWSSDGERLYAGGEFRGEGLTPLILWPERGRGKPQTLPLARNRINELQTMPEGRIAYATEDPGFGLIDARNEKLSFRGPDILDFSRDHGRLELSPDGSTIRFPAGKEMRTYSVFGAGDQSLAAPPAGVTQQPRLESPRIMLADWKNSFAPKINGLAPKLDDYEMIRSYAFTPEGERVLLGTEWGLRLYDDKAQLVWNVALPAVAWSVAVSPNGRLAVAALSDGTIRWYRMDRGSEVFAFFPHANGNDWIGWVPDGYYFSSVFGDNFVGWHLNRGRDLTPDFFRAVQFERLLYRPDVVTAAFRSALAPSRRGIANFPADANFRIIRLRDIAPPRIILSVENLDAGSNSARARIRIEGERSGLDIADYTLFVNGVPVTPPEQRLLKPDERRKFSRTAEIELTSKTNVLRVEAFNGTAMGVGESFLPLEREYPVPAKKGDLYVLAVGVDSFSALPTNLHLSYAARDADAIAKRLRERAVSQYRRVHVRVLNDGSDIKPDRQAVIDALQFIKASGPDDTALVFLASHGISDAAGNYYFVPRDAELHDIARASRGEPANSLIGWSVFFDALRNATGRRALIVDTCQARSIEGKFEAHSLLKRSAASLFPLLVASKGDEESQEYDAGQHGLFTYAILESLSADADANRDGIVSLAEVFAQVSPIVERLYDREIGKQTPQLVAPLDLGNTPMLRRANW